MISGRGHWFIVAPAQMFQWCLAAVCVLAWACLFIHAFMNVQEQLCVCVCVIGGSGRTCWGVGGRVFGPLLNIAALLWLLLLWCYPNLQLGGSHFRLLTLEKAMTSRFRGGGGLVSVLKLTAGVGWGCGGSQDAEQVLSSNNGHIYI